MAPIGQILAHSPHFTQLIWSTRRLIQENLEPKPIKAPNGHKYRHQNRFSTRFKSNIRTNGTAIIHQLKPGQMKSFLSAIWKYSNNGFAPVVIPRMMMVIGSKYMNARLPNAAITRIVKRMTQSPSRDSWIAFLKWWGSMRASFCGLVGKGFNYHILKNKYLGLAFIVDNILIQIIVDVKVQKVQGTQRR